LFETSPLAPAIPIESDAAGADQIELPCMADALIVSSSSSSVSADIETSDEESSSSDMGPLPVATAVGILPG